MRIGLALLGLAALALAPAASAGVHQDDRVGYKIKTPADWTTIPTAVDEAWVVAGFLSDKSDFWTDKASGWTWEHKPTMQVIAFVASVVEDIDPDVEEEGDGSWTIRFKNPFKDYADFMDRTYQEGGFHVEARTETEVEGVAATCFDIRVERLTYDGPKRILTWVFHAPEVDLAVQFECIEDAFEDYEKEFKRCLRSFRLVPRTEGSLASDAATPFTAHSWKTMTAEERAARRRSLQEAAHARATASLPEGWKAAKVGRFLVLNHSDEKFGKRVVEQAGAVVAWLEATFPFVGEGELVREPIVRICKDSDEQQAFYRNRFSWSDIEIVCCQDQAGVESWQAGFVNRQVARLWFVDRDLELWLAMPWWLQRGLDEVLGRLHVKSGKVDFREDYWDRDQMRQWLREQKLAPARDLMKMGAESFMGDFWQRQTEAASLVRFFVSGDAKKSKTSRVVLEQYVRNLQAVIRELEPEEEKAEKDAPKTEEEEDRWFQDRQKSWKEKERRLLEETWQRTFRSWSEKDWKAFDAAYLESIG